MAHLVYTDEKTRLEVNLDQGEAADAAEFLLGLIRSRGAPPAPACDCGLPLPAPEQEYAGSPFGQKPPGFGHLTSAGPGVAEATVVQISDLAEQHGPPIEEPEPVVLASVPDSKASARPLPRTCVLDECDVVFQPTREQHRFCCTAHKNKHNARVYRANQPAPSEGGDFKCPDCPRTFATSVALGGHRSVHPGEKPRNAKRKATSTPPATVDQPAPKVTPPVDRPYRCKEEGCGHPCRSQGELDSHRRAYHDTRQGLPKRTAVLGALTFPCPEDGCDRVYDDENRLTHHRRVIHDYEAQEPVHEVTVHGHHGEKVG